jgi:hypothetical protein
LCGARAVVEVHGSIAAHLTRGRYAVRVELDGPALLEKADGRWRVVDFTRDGRRRSKALVFGPLAEQHQHGVSARVLAVDRSVA